MEQDSTKTTINLYSIKIQRENACRLHVACILFKARTRQLSEAIVKILLTLNNKEPEM